MSKFKINHHIVIESALKKFNADFFFNNNILFGGGTRIALDLGEFRKSIDIDFLCPNKASYRAVRENVTNVSLGCLVKEDFDYVREISCTRDAVRAMFKFGGAILKLEFVCFDNYEISPEKNDSFPVPYLDRESCFYTKLLANSDRCMAHPYKDIVDILAMCDQWGGIPKLSITKAESHYGVAVVRDLIRSLDDVILKKDEYVDRFIALDISKDYSMRLVYEIAPVVLASLQKG